MLKTFAIIIFWIYCCFSILKSLRKIYTLCFTIHGYLIAYLIHFQKTIKNEVATPHRLLKTLLILMQELIKKHWMISSVSLLTINMLLLPLEYIVRLSLLSVDDIDLSFIIRSIFHSSGILKLYFRSPACGLNFSRYSFFGDFSSPPMFYSKTLPSKVYASFSIYSLWVCYFF